MTGKDQMPKTAIQNLKVFSFNEYKRQFTKRLEDHFILIQHLLQKQGLEVFCNKEAFKNLAKLSGKHIYWRLFFNNVAGDTPTQDFSNEFC